ncbi:MAG: hypothetical protein FRX49_02250 [Trebouxia sp. A1-2]|nr:MAG: hypothetical protein FRX49_02250 [Trebouxia sp. A1-2]
MPAKKHFKNSTVKSPYECLQNDILQFQGRGANILICGDMNARTAEQDDYIRLSELPPCLDVPDEADDLPDYVQPRHNCDKIWDPSQTWGPELLDLCKDTSLLILNGRTPGDDTGKHTFVSKSCHGRSAIDYFVASAHCMSATVFLQVNEDADDYCTDHHSVVLHMLCEALSESQSSASPASTAARVRYDAQNASAYQQHLTHELSMHYVPLLWQDADVDALSTALAECAKTAVCETTPQACERRGAPARKSEPWYDQSCKDAYQHNKHVSQCPQSTAEQKKVAQTRYDSVTSRAKQIWMQRRNDELVEKSNKDSRHFWKVYKTRKRDSCPVSLPEQKEAFQTLYGTVCLAPLCMACNRAAL